MADRTQASRKAKPKRGLGRGLSALISAEPVPVKQRADDQPVDDQRAAERVGIQNAVRQALAEDEGNQRPTAAGQEVKSRASEKVVSMPARAGEQRGVDESAAGEAVRYIDISLISGNPAQPRKQFAEQEIEELASSIRELGVLQPVLVRPSGQNKGAYEIVAGERRWRAAQRAEILQIPVIIKSFNDRETLEVAIVENVQRSDLSPLEEAAAYQRLIDEFSLSQKEVARKVGKDRSSVANYIRLLKLPEAVQQYLREGEISLGHAKAILTVKEPSAQLSLARKVVSESLSVRALEKIVSRVVILDKKKSRKLADVGSSGGSVIEHFPDVVDKMRKALGTKVSIKHHPSGRGKIEIDYFSEDELDRLIDKICD